MSTPELTVETFRALYDRLRAMPPVVVAIWFVDRPAEYAAVRARYGPPGGPLDPFAIRLYEWWTAFATEEDLARAPSFVSEPGIWAQMSDGTHRRIG